MKALLTFAIILIWTQPLFAQQTNCHGPNSGKMTFERLVEIIQVCKTSNIDKLLPLLPKSFRSKFALMYKSHSLQGASPENPRVIMYGEDSTFILAFNGDPKQFGYNSIEVVQFRDDSKEFEFRRISFSEDEKKSAAPVISEKNPESCLMCHRGSPRPNWESYPNWPGAYGSRDDSLIVKYDQRSEHARIYDMTEFDAFVGFLKAASKSPRYRTLVGLEALRKEPTPYDLDQRFGHAQHNNTLSTQLYRLMAERAVSLIRSNKEFKKYQHAILAHTAGCPDVVQKHLSSKTRAAFTRTLEAIESETILAHADYKNDIAQDIQNQLPLPVSVDCRMSSQPDADFDVSFSTKARNTPSFRYLIEEGLGVPTEDWSLTLKSATFSFVSPLNFYREIERILFFETSKTDTELAKSRRTFNFDDNQTDYIDHFSAKYGQYVRTSVDGKAYCDLLEQRSLSATETN